jgi:hypothetical protein
MRSVWSSSVLVEQGDDRSVGGRQLAVAVTEPDVRLVDDDLEAGCR